MSADRHTSRASGLRGPRWRLAVSCALCALALAGGGYAAAPAFGASAASESNAFSELTQGSQQQQTTPTTETKTTSEESSSTNSKALVFGALGLAVVLLVGIAYVIARDARRVAPAGETHGGESAFTRDPAVRLRKRRAKAKAARQQRKRNR